MDELVHLHGGKPLLCWHRDRYSCNATGSGGTAVTCTELHSGSIGNDSCNITDSRSTLASDHVCTTEFGLTVGNDSCNVNVDTGVNNGGNIANSVSTDGGITVGSHSCNGPHACLDLDAFLGNIGDCQFNTIPIPACLDASRTQITANPTSQSVDNSATITVRAVDTSNNYLTTGGDTVTLTTDHGTLSTVKDNGNGTYTATLSDTVAETDTVSGTINGTTITGLTSTAAVQFTPGAARSWSSPSRQGRRAPRTRSRRSRR